MSKMKLSIYTPETALLVQKPVQEVLVPSAKGELGILPSHAALISLLQAGVLKYKTAANASWDKVAIGWGYLEVLQDEVKVLAESAQTKEALDLAQTEKKLQVVEQTLKRRDLEPKERERLEKERLRLQGEKDL